MLTDARLERDLAVPASQAFLVLAVELDAGPVFLAGRKVTLGADVVHGVALSIGDVRATGFSAAIERQGLPAYADGWWINRAVELLECTSDMESVHDGALRFAGAIAAEPAEAGGVISLEIAPLRKKVKPLPGLGLVTATDWPLAADEAMGAELPMIFGTVDECPLLAVRVPPHTTLAEPAAPGDAQLVLADATALGATGSVTVDGHTYTYTARSDTVLMGMAVTAAHRPGTLVAQAGDTVYLAAGEAVAALGTLKGDGAVLDGGTVSLAAATVTYSAPPAVVAASERFTRFVQFDETGSGNTATNPTSAIRAVINTYTQSGTPSGTVTAAAAGTIAFARPADGNRIVAGSYAVQFSVALGAQVGWARVKIGNQVAWLWQPVDGVLYNASPVTVALDQDTDVLPVAVEVAEGGTTDQVTVTIVTASRTIYTGNLDDANFATVANGQALKVKQTSVNADLGPIAAVRLGVRWFQTDANAGTSAVTFAGRALGKLAVTQAGGASLNRTITVDVTAQGVAALPQQAISTTVSGGTASLGHNTIPQAISLPASYAHIGTAIRGFSLAPPFTGWDLSLGQIAVKVQFSGNDLTLGPWANFRRADHALIAQANSGNLGTLVQVATDIWQGTMALNEAPAEVYWDGTWGGNNGTTFPTGVIFSYNARPTSGVVTQANTPASGSSAPISAQNLTHSGTAVTVTNGTVQLTVPAPPRMTDTLFDLSWVREWADLTNTVAEIALTGTGASLCITQVWIEVEYDARTMALPAQVTATVTGRSGNPAEVIAFLAEASGETVEPAAKARFSAWCTAAAFAFARRLDAAAEALTLLQFALEQAACDLYPSPLGLVMRRWADEGCTMTTLTDADLTEPARIRWAGRVDTDLTLRYRPGHDDARFNAGGDMTRVATATAANNAACARAEAALLERRALELDGGWLRADACAAIALAATVARFAVPRREATLKLPYSFAEVEAGDLLDWVRSSTDAARWRVLEIAREDGWVGIEAEELPQTRGPHA